MGKMLLFSMGFALICAAAAAADKQFETDMIRTSRGDMIITFLGHGSLMMSCEGKVVYIDPVAPYADYAKMPKADLILVTHEHSDHLDLKAIGVIKTSNTGMVVTENVSKQIPDAVVMKNGDTTTVQGFKIEAVPAFNVVHMRSPGMPFHPKGVGNGYIVNFGDTRVYFAGDTENTPEMMKLQGIDIAFLPMNLPYTMTPDMVADAVKSFRPKILYPYHYGSTDTAKIIELLKGEKDIEIRIRQMM